MRLTHLAVTLSDFNGCRGGGVIVELPTLHITSVMTPRRAIPATIATCCLITGQSVLWYALWAICVLYATPLVAVIPMRIAEEEAAPSWCAKSNGRHRSRGESSTKPVARQQAFGSQTARC